MNRYQSPDYAPSPLRIFGRILSKISVISGTILLLLYVCGIVIAKDWFYAFLETDFERQMVPIASLMLVVAGFLLRKT